MAKLFCESFVMVHVCRGCLRVVQMCNPLLLHSSYSKFKSKSNAMINVGDFVMMDSDAASE